MRWGYELKVQRYLSDALELFVKLLISMMDSIAPELPARAELVEVFPWVSRGVHPTAEADDGPMILDGIICSFSI
jgi:hypothetical protein